MYKQIKKMPRYLFKLFQHGSVKDVFHIFENVKLEHLLIALAARLDRKPTSIAFRNGLGSHEINQFLDLIPFRKSKITKDIYLWEFGKKQIFANYTQVTGVHSEYVLGVFDDIYNCDWKNKNVVDIGGFVGDTALYFLSQAANKVIIYEPVPKNVVALRLNLQGKENQIQCYEMALSNRNGPVTFYSQEPEGSCGFGQVNEGNHKVDCLGTTISSILAAHQPIDIIKVDCEGGEVNLLGMTKEEALSVPHWIIETHSLELYEGIVNKFTESGFVKTYDQELGPGVNLLHFKVA